MRGQLLRSICRVFSVAFLFLGNGSLLAQVVVVKDTQGNALPGVEVYNHDLSIGTVTDRKGEVDLSSASGDELIFFRYLGYEDRSLLMEQIRKSSHEVILTVSDQLMEEVVVLGRKTIAQSDIPFQIKSISVEEIESTNPQTSADALDQHGGVFVQKSQMGGGSPVIRGFEANRVLLVVDGIRMNNAIYRSGHLQNAVTVDQAMLEEMEVIFGPNSLMYGSDALGGVVNFKTRSPKLAPSSQDALFNSQYFGRFSSANNERSFHADFSYGKKTWGSLTSLTFSDFGDLRTGSKGDLRYPEYGERTEFQAIGENGQDVIVQNEEPTLQVGTAYRQYDLLQKFLFIPGPNYKLSLNFQHSTSSDVPRYDNLSEYRNGALRWAEWYYGPQTRTLVSLDLRHLQSTLLYDQLIVIGSFQHIDEDRISRLFGSALRNTQEEDVDVYGMTIDASKYFTKEHRWQLDYGLDMQHNDVLSQAYDENKDTGQVSENVLTRYASGGNQLTSYGAYLYVSGKNKKESINFNAGVRFTRTNFNLKYDPDDPVTWPSSFYEGISGNNQAITWSIGANWSLSESWQLRGMISTAFRSPNIDDLAKVRINGGEITFPNIDLQPEKSTNFEATIATRKNQILNFSLTGFYTRLTDAIVRRPFRSPDGGSFWTSQGESLMVVGNQNTQRGQIAGLSTTFDGHFSSPFSWMATINYTRGREIGNPNERIPLAHIPPIYGKISLIYKKNAWQFRSVFRYNFTKDILDYGGSEDNPELATIDGAPGWQTYNLYTTYNWDKVDITLGLENILDKHYRLFSSGVSAPGRNLIISLRAKF